MSRLSEDLHPALTPDILATLFNKSIFNSLAFVRTNPELLAKTTGLQYCQILQIKDKILNTFSSPLRDGNKYYQNFLKFCAIFPSGIAKLDKLLDNGFMTGNIYELCGFSGSGKTQTCMTIIAHICSKRQEQVFYINTKNDMSAQRLSDIIEHQNVSNIGEVMQKVQICQANSSYDLLQQLHEIGKKIKNSKEKHLGFKLIIIDSLSALFQRFHEQSEGLPLLNEVASLLKYLCVEFHLVVLLTNYVSSWIPEVSEMESEDDVQLNCQQIQIPAMGKYWAHIPNVRIMIKKLGNSNECLLTILKSSQQPIGKTVKVKICDSGVM